MALPGSGTITMAQIRAELQSSGAIDLNNSRVRQLAGRSSGQISMSDLHGKSYEFSGTTSRSLSVNSNNTNEQNKWFYSGSVSVGISRYIAMTGGNYNVDDGDHNSSTASGAIVAAQVNNSTAWSVTSPRRDTNITLPSVAIYGGSFRTNSIRIAFYSSSYSYDESSGDDNEFYSGGYDLDYCNMNFSYIAVPFALALEDQQVNDEKVSQFESTYQNDEPAGHTYTREDIDSLELLERNDELGKSFYHDEKGIYLVFHELEKKSIQIGVETFEYYDEYKDETITFFCKSLLEFNKLEDLWGNTNSIVEN